MRSFETSFWRSRLVSEESNEATRPGIQGADRSPGAQSPANPTVPSTAAPAPPSSPPSEPSAPPPAVSSPGPAAQPTEPPPPAEQPRSFQRIDRFLKLMADRGASDLHLSTGRAPMLRLSGGVEAIRYRVIDGRDFEGLIQPITAGAALEAISRNGRCGLCL